MYFLRVKWKIVTLLLAIVSFIAYLLSSYLSNYSDWTHTKTSSNDWIRFFWVEQELNGQKFEHAGMNVYCKVKGFNNTFSFQFDLGAELTGVYEYTYSSLPHREDFPIKKLKSKLLFLNKDKYVDDLALSFGSYQCTTKMGYVYNEMGDFIKKYDDHDTIHLGTIGRDIFKDKVLLIDYPHCRFKILDCLPTKYKQEVSTIEIDRTGKIVLPMRIKNKQLKITFDTGSSLFPLIASERKIHHFTHSKSSDTLTITSWGKKHQVDSKIITTPFTIAHHSYKNVKIYVNHSGLGIDESTDGMAGNALFLNHLVIIDFKNKRFGVLEPDLQE